MKQIRRYLPFLTLLSFGIPFAHAQSALDVNIGFGGAWDSANKSGIDNNTGATCTPLSSNAATCSSLPALSGFFLGFGGDVMVKDKIGFGMNFSIQPARQDYGPLQDRQSFFDFNAVYKPVQTKKAALNLEAGIGVARTSFSVTQTQCVGTAACSTVTSPFATANHFQEHLGVGVQLFLTEHFYVRPQFDVHFVNGFTDQFGRNVVPQAMVWVGYNLGSK